MSTTPVWAFASAQDGKEIAVGYHDGVHVYTPANVTEVRKFDIPGATAVAWSKDGKTLAVALSREKHDQTPRDNPPVAPDVLGD